jgi:hypothetical protein
VIDDQSAPSPWLCQIARCAQPYCRRIRRRCRFCVRDAANYLERGPIGQERGRPARGSQELAAKMATLPSPSATASGAIPSYRFLSVPISSYSRVRPFPAEHTLNTDPQEKHENRQIMI